MQLPISKRLKIFCKPGFEFDFEKFLYSAENKDKEFPMGKNIPRNTFCLDIGINYLIKSATTVQP
jgi:hypothetical protein